MGFKTTFVIGTIGGIVGMYAMYSYREFNFDQAYNKVMLKYSDKDKDGILSDDERDYFKDNIYYKILSDHDAVLIDDEARYRDGKAISKRDLTDWLNDYHLKNN